MRRAVLAAASTATLVVLLLALKPHEATQLAVGAPASTPTPTSTPTSSSTPSTTASPAASSGTYTGDAISTRYGTVQLAITVTDGELTAVNVLQVPSEGRSQQIAADAVPRLTAEALTAQSARIDAISGASYTSQGYIDSLQSALDKTDV
ncbi:FMN-binding protein [Streptomyces paludis]|uniref:FMN-binding protein n=1 Tax=Streptomyces paludis TaxID=2282738 RepID=A0A345HX21_9ACTN|nr:FMN-binding protein [Streptomyces paludis]AXG81245.1 FMN-binding protein [Streptomyces paludis]